ncbi:MAG TPA: peptidoglycan DD-metalloendopeptidase family protein [Gallionellaceae bacterium]|nr:peptidoglycan DD-metalloendopeptidase family protein [Gallionellaceae bacterium]
MRCINNLFGLLLLALPLAAQAGLPASSSVPGGVAVIPLGGDVKKDPAPEAWLGKHRVLVAPDHGEWYAVVGVPLDTKPGEQQLQVSTGGASRSLAFDVGPKAYPEQHITLKSKRKVDLSPKDLKRALREIAQIKALKLHWRDTPRTDLDFIEPVDGQMGSAFGLRRFFNGEARSPHSGIDLVVPSDTPVKAAGQGQVLAVGDYFFNGKTVFVDHGDGLITMYCHLSHIEVKPGEKVGKGQEIARSGMTGRATGPHLHWSVVLNGAMVDPALFLPGQKYARQ